MPCTWWCIHHGNPSCHSECAWFITDFVMGNVAVVVLAQDQMVVGWTMVICVLDMFLPLYNLCQNGSAGGHSTNEVEHFHGRSLLEAWLEREKMIWNAFWEHKDLWQQSLSNTMHPKQILCHGVIDWKMKSTCVFFGREFFDSYVEFYVLWYWRKHANKLHSTLLLLWSDLTEIQLISHAA
jgi:hypothetical protein